MDLLGYDAFVSGMSQSPYVQGFDVATMAVPVSSGVSASQPAGATVQQAAPATGGIATNGKPLTHNGFLGQPHHWWLILVGVYIGLQFLAKRFGVPRFTILQSVILVLQWIVVIVALKVVAARYTIPGLSPIIISV